MLAGARSVAAGCPRMWGEKRRRKQCPASGPGEDQKPGQAASPSFPKTQTLCTPEWQTEVPGGELAQLASLQFIKTYLPPFLLFISLLPSSLPPAFLPDIPVLMCTSLTDRRDRTKEGVFLLALAALPPHPRIPVLWRGSRGLPLNTTLRKGCIRVKAMCPRPQSPSQAYSVSQGVTSTLTCSNGASRSPSVHIRVG